MQPISAERGSPESLLSVLHAFRSVSIILKVISAKHGRWENEIAIFFFFLFIWNPASSLTTIRTETSARDSIRFVFRSQIAVDRFFTKQILYRLTYDSNYIRSKYKNHIYIYHVYIHIHTRSNLISWLIAFCSTIDSTKFSHRSLGDLCASIAKNARDHGSKSVKIRGVGYWIEGGEKIQQQPPGSPYSSHGSPLRTPMSSGHGTPQDSPHVARHRRDSEHSAGVGSRRGSSDVVSPLPDAPPSGSPDNRPPRRRSDYSPHQGRSHCDSRLRQFSPFYSALWPSNEIAHAHTATREPRTRTIWQIVSGTVCAIEQKMSIVVSDQIGRDLTRGFFDKSQSFF